MGKRAWVKSIGKKLREDLGDCPTLPPEMLHLLDETPPERTAGGVIVDVGTEAAALRRVLPKHIDELNRDAPSLDVSRH